MPCKPDKIDAHVHLWRLSRGDYGWLTPDLTSICRDFEPADLRAVLQSAKIDRAVLVQAAPTIEETRFLLRLAEATPEIAGVVGWVDFESPDAAQDLAALGRSPWLKSVRPMIQDIADPDWMLKPELHDAFSAVIEQNLCFDALVLPRHLPRLRRLLERYPELRTIIDHGAKPRIAEQQFDDWARDMRSIAESGPVCCKLSGLITEAGHDWTLERLQPYVDHLMACFGPERLIWGSDWPVVRLAGDYRSWLETAMTCLATLSDRQKAAVFGGNAQRFYQLATA